MTDGIFSGRIKDGKVTWNDPKAANQYCANLEGQAVIVTVAPRRNRDQNSAFHALCNELAVYGYTPAQWKAFFKKEYLCDPSRSTADLSHEEMGGLLENSTCWAAEHVGVRPRQLA